MGPSRGVLSGIVWLFIVLPAVATADDKPVPPVKASSPKVSAKQVDEWIGQLSSRDFKVRQQASQNLVAAGRDAIVPVARAADTADLDLCARCIAVLKKLHVPNNPKADAATTAAAEAALTKLTRSKRRSVAQRAAAALPQPDLPRPVRRGGVIQLNVANIGRNAFRMSVRTVNGQRQIQVSEVVEEKRKVEITDTKGKNITVTVTEMVKGKKDTAVYKAADEAALKKKHPEMHKLYRKYTAAKPVRGPIQIRGARFGPPLAPRQVPGPRLLNVWLQDARKRIMAGTLKLNKLAAQPSAKPEELKAVLEDLRAAQQQLDRALRSVGPQRFGARKLRKTGKKPGSKKPVPKKPVPNKP